MMGVRASVSLDLQVLPAQEIKSRSIELESIRYALPPFSRPLLFGTYHRKIVDKHDGQGKKETGSVGCFESGLACTIRDGPILPL